MTERILLPAAGLVSGTIFGLGLAVSQMTNPDKVLSFLDLFGQWDPSLLLTMAAAILVTSLGYRLVLHKGPLISGELHLPTSTDIDKKTYDGVRDLRYRLGDCRLLSWPSTRWYQQWPD